MQCPKEMHDRFNFLESICNKITSCFFQCKLYIITIFILIRLFKDDEAQKWKAEDLATQEQFLKSYMKKKKGKILSCLMFLIILMEHLQIMAQILKMVCIFVLFSLCKCIYFMI